VSNKDIIEKEVKFLNKRIKVNEKVIDVLGRISLKIAENIEVFKNSRIGFEIDISDCSDEIMQKVYEAIERGPCNIEDKKVSGDKTKCFLLLKYEKEKHVKRIR